MFRGLLLSVLAVAGIQILDAKPHLNNHHEWFIKSKGDKAHPLFMPKVDKECMKECGCQEVSFEEEKDCKLFCRFNCLTDEQYSEVNDKFVEEFGQDIGEIGVVEAVKIWRSSKKGESEEEGDSDQSIEEDSYDHEWFIKSKGDKAHPLFMPKVNKECMKECGCQEVSFEEEKDCKLFCRFNCLTDEQYSEVNDKFVEEFGQDIGEIGVVEAVKIWRSSKKGESEEEGDSEDQFVVQAKGEMDQSKGLGDHGKKGGKKMKGKWAESDSEGKIKAGKAQKGGRSMGEKSLKSGKKQRSKGEKKGKKNENFKDKIKNAIIEKVSDSVEEEIKDDIRNRMTEMLLKGKTDLEETDSEDKKTKSGEFADLKNATTKPKCMLKCVKKCVDDGARSIMECKEGCTKICDKFFP